ncbi:MAG: acyl-CoA dehydrogenase [Sphingomonadales bacterium]|nr:acyl-CoA dehydrogenase [Sphingomonadales bacterium]MBU3992303.1 acyl-CoA dehydrogenase [Alphaproteobacteria bacterium]
MNLELSGDQLLLKESFERLFRTDSSPARVRAAEPAGFDQDLWQSLAEMGALTMRVPEADGGGGFSLLDAQIVAEEAGKALASAPLIEAMVSNRLLARLTAVTDNPEIRALLDRAMHKNAVITLALFDVADRPEQIIAGGSAAEVVLALDGDRILACESGRQEDFLENLADLPIARWNLTEGALLAEGEAARAEFGAALEEWKLLTAAELNGMARRTVELATAYASERIQFGKPIGTYQGIAHPLANLIMEIDGGQLLNWWAASRLADGASDAGATISMSFWWAAKTAGQAGERALHTHGGYGLSLEYDVQLYHRRTKARALLLGDPNDELLNVGRRSWLGETPALPEAGAMPLDFGFGDAAAKLSAETEAFFRDNMTPELEAKAHFSFEGHDWDFHRKLGTARLLFPSWPEEFGGRNADPYAAVCSAAVWDEHNWGRVGTGVTDMVGHMIQWFGHPETKAEVLPLLARGEATCSLGYSEPGSGSDVFAARTRAVRDGEEWVINGQKMFTSGAELASYIFLLTRTDPDAPKHKGVTMFLVPIDTPGIEIRPIYTFQDERTNTTFYADVRIPDRFRIGEVNGGTAVLGSALRLEQGGGGYVPVHDKMLELAVKWAQQTKRAGKPAIEDTSVLSRLSRIAVHGVVSDMLSRRSLWTTAEGKQDLAYGPMSKVFAVETYNQDSTDLLDLTAPDSILRRPGPPGQIERDHRRSTASTIYAGASEVLRSMIGEKALGLPRSR